MRSRDRVRIFVYDFGDWVEFEITVEAVGDEREAGVVYPRVVKRGKKGGDGERAGE